MSELMPIVYVAHGGGPLPLMGDPDHLALTEYMMHFARRFPTPKAIIVVTAHWEAANISLTGSTNPSMLFDYYGFPPETYQLDYPAPGSPELAQRIYSALQLANIDVEIDEHRGFDHGTFVPLLLMYPEAKIPVVQMSLKAGLSPVEHIAVGHTLASLRGEGVLILGSGLSFHNMRAFFSKDGSKKARSEAFDSWLVDTLCSTNIAPPEREKLLSNWAQAPEARFCHPREEHLLPLHVCLGAANGEMAIQDFSGYLFDTAISGFLWR